MEYSASYFKSPVLHTLKKMLVLNSVSFSSVTFNTFLWQFHGHKSSNSNEDHPGKEVVENAMKYLYFQWYLVIYIGII
jgi:hypothetical protein